MNLIRRLGWPAVLALAFIGGGFVIIGLAWNGAASIDFTQGQIPYLLSGGFAGLGLIWVGVALILFETGRRARQRIEERIELLTRYLEGLAEATVPRGRIPSRSVAADEAVVIGATSFHRADCRLIEGKEDVTAGTISQALSRGLTPCRVCQPVAA